jgi:hypothetical protein
MRLLRSYPSLLFYDCLQYGDNDTESESDYNYTRHLASSVEGKLPLHCPEVYSYLSGFTTGWMITRLSILTLYVIIALYVKPQGIYLLQSKAPILITSIVHHLCHSPHSL